MNTAVIYYSLSGKTDKVAKCIIEILTSRGEHADLIRLRPVKEETSFKRQCRDAFFAKKPELIPTTTDLRKYNRIILGTPVWAFKPAPSINTYINMCSSLDAKEAIVFATYGSGVGRNNTLKIMKKMLQTKGAHVTKEILIQGNEDQGIYRKRLENLL